MAPIGFLLRVFFGYRGFRPNWVSRSVCTEEDGKMGRPGKEGMQVSRTVYIDFDYLLHLHSHSFMVLHRH